MTDFQYLAHGIALAGCIGAGALIASIGPGISEGSAAAAACETVGRQPGTKRHYRAWSCYAPRPPVFAAQITGLLLIFLAPEHIS